MAIPDDILKVERPKSTRVKESFGRYLVIKRTSKRVGNRVVPVELGTIGEIINGQYVELREKPKKKSTEVDIKSYGEFALCNKVAGSLLKELVEVFDVNTAKKLFVIALLRTIEPDIKNRDISVTYETNYISEIYKNIALSENTISKFLEDIGKKYRYISQFMENKISQYPNNKLAIDGTLKDNNSYTNTYSDYSRKGKTKGSKDISILYAYDIETKEPLAAKPYPGNMLDQTALIDFQMSFSIDSGIIVIDKGFYSPENIKYLKQQENLTYILPLKNSMKLVTENLMTKDIVNPLDGYKDGTVFWKKKKVKDDCYLYSFRNPLIASEQEIAYVTQAKKKGDFSTEKLISKKDQFGVIVFESKSDMSPLDIYTAYTSRWEIEVMFNLYKDILDMDTVNVHGDYRLYATEFINYLSVIIASRIKKTLSTTVLHKSAKNGNVYVSDKYSYRQVMKYLSKCKMVRVGESKKWVQSKTVGYISELCNALV